MSKGLLFLCLMLAVFKAFGQTCVHANLSKSLLFKTEVTRIKRAAIRDSCLVRITVSRKQAPSSGYAVAFSTVELYDSDYTKCHAVRSYTTGQNRSAVAIDNDYGDLVIADFNFDGREDFAVKLDAGGNGGPLYGFYLQEPNGQFKVNTFLTEWMQFFPKHFDAHRHTLTTLVHAGARELCESTYQVNVQTANWHKISRRFVPHPSVSR